MHVVQVPPGSEQDTVARLAGNPDVRFAELDRLAPPAANVNDPSFGKEWHLAQINAPTAWDTSTGSGITIAILDSGVDGTHPDLAAQLVPGWNFFDDNGDTSDVLGHGTAVAGVAAAASNNGIGIAGVAGGARIMPIRITNATGYAYWSTTAQGLIWAADHGADVANLSLEGMAASSTMQTAANYFRSKGGTVIVAAGNAGTVDNTAPTDTMIVVSATDSRDRIASLSSFGNFVSISAPGQSIYSTARGGGYGTWSGTSMAAPMVAGTAALILAVRPDLSPTQVDSTLFASATDLGATGRDIYFGYGRVNAAAAVQAAVALPLCTRTNPTLTITPSQSAGVKAGTMVPFNITVTNNDTTACAASTFDLTRSVPAGWTATFLSLALSLSPGTSGSTTLQVMSPAGTANSSNAITATATNRNANTFVRSGSATYVVANAAVCTRANPTLVITPSQSAGVKSGTMVPFNVTVTNNDTSACAASTFDLIRIVPAGWTASFLSLALSLSPGMSGSTTLQVTSTAGTPNSFSSITATATNRNANTFVRAAAATYVVANAVPGAPTIGTATAGNAQATVSFTAPASNGGSAITTYTVTTSPGGITKSGAASPIAVTGLTNGTAYTFTVKATNAVGSGAASAASNSVTPAAPINVPGTPTIGTATAGNAQATVTYAAPASNGGSAITSYTVTSSPGGVTATGTASPIAVPGLTNGTAYIFTVKATNAVGTGAASVASNAVTPVAPITGRIYYVSTSGSDANDGLSTARPFSSLAKAESVATSAGDIIALKRGDIWSSTTALRISHGGTTGKPIVWDGGLWGSGANAVIQSSGNRISGNMAVVNIVGASHVTFQKITVDGNNTQTFGLVIGGSNGYYSKGALQNAESYITVQDSTIKNCGNGGDYRLGLLVQTWHNDISNIVIQRVSIDGVDDEALSFYPGRSDIGATPAQIRNSYIGYNMITNYGRRQTSTSYGLQINNKITNVVVERNTITTGASGFGNGMQIESNEPILGYFPTGIIVRYNDIRVTNRWALFFQGIHGGQAITADVYYNKFSSATTSGDGGGITIQSSTPDYTGAILNFYNNVIYTTGGRGINDSSMTTGIVTFKNNIVYHTGNDQWTQYCINITKAGSMIHSNNALFRSAGATMTVVSEAGTYKTRSVVSAWEPTAVTADPLMAGPTTFNFALQSTSPAIDSGINVGLSSDYAGTSVPQHSAPDIGLFEWK